MYIYFMKNKRFLFLAYGLVILSIALVAYYFKGCAEEEKCKGKTANADGLKGKVKIIIRESYKGLDVSKLNDFQAHHLVGYSLSRMEFDKNGDAIIQELYDSAGFSQKIVYQYDDFQRLAREDTFDKNGKYLGSERYEYNEEENLITISYYKLDSSGNDKCTMKEIQNYNESCMLIKKITTDESGELMDLVTFKYDNSGFLIEKVQVFGTQSVEYIHSYLNDNLGNVLTEKLEAEGIWNGVYVKDFLLETHSCSYTFDEYGNWVTGQIFLNSQPQSFTKRSLTYW